MKTRLQKRRGQTAYEYAMMIAAIVVPLALSIRAIIVSEGEKKAAPAAITDRAYGDEKRMGIIGRPYP